MPMDEKIQLIGSAIAGQAEAERRSIIDKANEIRERELSTYEEHLVETMFDKVQKRTREVRQNAIREKAQVELRSHRELLGRREELATTVFAAAKAQIHEYTASADYRKTLLDSIKAAQGQWDHSGSVVYLRQEDIGLADQVQKTLPGCKVDADPEIKLGGFRLYNQPARILMDETLDTRLEEQRPWFLQNCGLRVV